MRIAFCTTLLTCMACNPGKVADEAEEISDWNWEAGAQEPAIGSGQVYCETGASGVTVFFIEVVANDPQGASDLKEGVWRAFGEGQEDPVVEDLLYCDQQECLYSFHADQYPEIACALIQDFRFTAEVFDYSGNSTGEIELTVLSSS